MNSLFHLKFKTAGGGAVMFRILQMEYIDLGQPKSVAPGQGDLKPD